MYKLVFAIPMVLFVVYHLIMQAVRITLKLGGNLGIAAALYIFGVAPLSMLAWVIIWKVLRMP